MARPDTRTRELVKWAVRFQAKLHRPAPDLRAAAMTLDDLASFTQALQKQVKKAERCISQGMYTSAVNLLESLQWTTRGAINQSSAFSRESIKAIKKLSSPQETIPLKYIYEDLRALEDDFDNVTVGYERGSGALVISADTDEIVLEGMAFGSFTVTILIYSDNQHTLEVRPTGDGNYASGSDCVCHPHVEEPDVCMGDGSTPFHTAMRDGRIYDAFTIINRLLHTYNPDSPYVSIDDWDKPGCCDCGDSTHSGSSTTCRTCSGHLCDECGRACEECDDVYCGGCDARLSRCAKCDSLICRGCGLTTCEGCSRAFCSSCHTRCDACDNAHCAACDDDRNRHNCENKQSEDKDDPSETTELQEDGIQRYSVVPEATTTASSYRFTST